MRFKDIPISRKLMLAGLGIGFLYVHSKQHLYSKALAAHKLLDGMEDYQRTKKIMYKIGQWDPETKTIIHEPKESSTIYTGPISPQKADN